MKDKVSRSIYEDPESEEPKPETPGFDDMTPSCHACGEENVGMGVPTVLALPGMLFPSMEYDVPVFIPDPDAKLRVITLPNGQLGFVTDQDITKYNHGECYQNLIDEVAYHDVDVDTEDDEDDADEDED